MMESTSDNIFLIPRIVEVKNVKSLDISALMEQIIIKPIHVLQSDPNSVSLNNGLDILPVELPKFFESKENRSQQIISRLEQIEKKVDDDIDSSKQMQNESEKPSAEFVEELKKIVHQKIQELKEKNNSSDGLDLSFRNPSKSG